MKKQTRPSPSTENSYTKSNGMPPFQLHQLRHICTMKKKRVKVTLRLPWIEMPAIFSRWTSVRFRHSCVPVCLVHIRWRNITIHRNKLISCWYKPIFGKFSLVFILFIIRIDFVLADRLCLLAEPYRPKWSVWKMWERKICVEHIFDYIRQFNDWKNYCNCSKSNWNHFLFWQIVVLAYFLMKRTRAAIA